MTQSNENTQNTVKTAASDVQYGLQLFIAGNEPNSVKAKENLIKICEKYINGTYALEVVDILREFQKAIDNGVLVTPMLIIKKPEPETTIVGCLTDEEQVKKALRV